MGVGAHRDVPFLNRTVKQMMTVKINPLSPQSWGKYEKQGTPLILPRKDRHEISLLHLF
jgi:hypothetical protein